MASKTANGWSWAAVLVICAAPALAQTGSGTLADTIQWLRANLGGAACVVFQMGPSREELKPVTENTEVRFADCDMTLETATTIGPRSELRTFHVALGKLPADAVSLLDGFRLPAGWIAAGEAPSYTMRLSERSGEGSFEGTLEQFGVEGAQPSVFKTAEIDILLRHQDTAEKLAAALTRAIALCRAN